MLEEMTISEPLKHYRQYANMTILIIKMAMLSQGALSYEDLINSQ